MQSSAQSPVTEKEVADFYDTFSHRLVRDYVKGNRRSDAALRRVLSVVTPEIQSVLDVGCGIGVSTAGYYSAAPWIRATGVDISPANIAVAKSLFQSPQLNFEVSALQELPVGGPFDLIALIDVYEHFPRDSWSRYNDTLGRLLTDKGTIVITTPSPLHQEFLRCHNPGGLQVIDETVELHDLQALASQIGATITQFEWVTIWNTNDYVHSVMVRQPLYGTRGPAQVKRQPLIRAALQNVLSRLDNSRARKAQESRRRLVEQRLSISVD